MPTAEPSLRLFLALNPPPAVRAALADHAARWTWGTGARRYAPADWHLTLHFLGAVPQARLDALRAGLAVPVSPFTLRFGRAQRWPHGLAVLLPEAVPDALLRLHERLGDAVRALGLATDARPYRPHLTLARHAAAAEPPAQAARFDWEARDYVLVESTGQAARRYRVLQVYGDAPAV